MAFTNFKHNNQFERSSFRGVCKFFCFYDDGLLMVSDRFELFLLTGDEKKCEEKPFTGTSG